MKLTGFCGFAFLLVATGCSNVAKLYLPEETINASSAGSMAPYVIDNKIDMSLIQYQQEATSFISKEQIEKAKQAYNRSTMNALNAKSQLSIAQENFEKKSDLKFSKEETLQDAQARLTDATKNLQAAIQAHKKAELDVQNSANLLRQLELQEKSYVVIEATDPNELFQIGIFLSNQSCELHKAQIRANSDSWNIAMGVTTLMLASAASVVDHAKTASDLATAAAFTSGTQAVVNSEVTSNIVDNIIIKTIENARQQKLQTLKQSIGNDYDIFQAINDIEAYHNTCSLNFALSAIEGAIEEKYSPISVSEYDRRLDIQKSNLINIEKQIAKEESKPIDKREMNTLTSLKNEKEIVERQINEIIKAMVSAPY